MGAQVQGCCCQALEQSVCLAAMGYSALMLAEKVMVVALVVGSVSDAVLGGAADNSAPLANASKLDSAPPPPPIVQPAHAWDSFVKSNATNATKVLAPAGNSSISSNGSIATSLRGASAAGSQCCSWPAQCNGCAAVGDTLKMKAQYCRNQHVLCMACDCDCCAQYQWRG